MAIALEKLEDQLNCPICLDTYIKPKLLQCNHVYCQQCLVKIVFRDQQGQLVLTCPNCRQVTPVPASGVAGLQSAFQINKFLDIVEEHKKATATAANSVSTSSLPENISIRCSAHGKREVELFCETCGETICFKCIKKGEKHHSHSYEELNEAFERYKEEMASLLEPMEKQLTTVKKGLADLDACQSEISTQQTTLEIDIHMAMLQLHEAIYTRETELIGQLHQLTQAKLRSLAVQRDQLEITQAQLSNCLHFMKENMKTSNQGEALIMKDTTVRRVKELTTTFQPEMLEANTKADMIFSAPEDLLTKCLNYGSVHAEGSPDPSKCDATCKGVEKAVVNETTVAVLQTLDYNSQPCKEPITSISCELVSEIAGTIERGSVERKGLSHFYEINYQPTIKGRHQLHIKVEGQHIRGSPFPVLAKLPVEEISTPILTIREVDQPMGVAVNQRGNVVVTEGGRHCVTVFSPSGERLRSFGTQGSGQGQILHPRGVATDPQGNILIADKGNHRIQKFTAEGKFLAAVGSQGSGPLQFLYPSSLAFNARTGRIYVADSKNNRIQILNSDFSHYASFGKKGSGKGQFDNPRHLACDSVGNMYVTDSYNDRIQVFTAEGKFCRMFKRCGKGRGELKDPYGIAVDTSGRVYVSERWSPHASVLTAEGEYVASFGSNPLGLAVDSSGVVFTCNCENNCIQLF